MCRETNTERDIYINIYVYVCRHTYELIHTEIHMQPPYSCTGTWVDSQARGRIPLDTRKVTTIYIYILSPAASSLQPAVKRWPVSKVAQLYAHIQPTEIGMKTIKWQYDLFSFLRARRLHRETLRRELVRCSPRSVAWGCRLVGKCALSLNNCDLH